MMRLRFQPHILRIRAMRERAESFFDDALNTYITEVFAQNFEDVWNTQGAAIGEDWNGRTLVRTGNLRNSLTSPVVVRIRNGWEVQTSVPYSSYVNDQYTFMALTDEALADLSRWVVENLLVQR